MKRRVPRDVRYAPTRRLATLWSRLGKHRIRRLERREARDAPRRVEDGLPREENE